MMELAAAYRMVGVFGKGTGKGRVKGRQVFAKDLTSAGSWKLSAHKTLAGGDADRGWSVGVVEDDTVFSQPVKVWSPDDRVSRPTG